MKKIIKVFFITLILSVFTVSLVYAEEEDDTNNLELDTEVLKNKKEDKNSTSTIGDNELFSTDFNNIIDNENSKVSKHYDELMLSVFHDIKNEKTNENSFAIFTQEVKFDKTNENDKETSNYYLMFGVATIVLLISTYIFTRRKYTKHSKGGGENVDNYYV
ncbi:MAG: hypothetical protein RR945_03445 [Erysipelotrichaceae bacterium]